MIDKEKLLLAMCKQVLFMGVELAKFKHIIEDEGLADEYEDMGAAYLAFLSSMIDLSAELVCQGAAVLDDPTQLMAFTEVLCHACNHGKGNWDQTDWRDNQEPLSEESTDYFKPSWVTH